MSETSTPPLDVVAYVEVVPAVADEIERGMRQWREEARRLPGCARFEAARRVSPGHHFVMLASWTDRAHFDMACKSAHSDAIRTGLGPHLIAGVDNRIHAALIGGSDAPRGSAGVLVVTHVDVPPPNKDACIGLLEVLVEASRREKECCGFEVMQQADRPNHFTVVERWTSSADQAAHMLSAHTRAFRHALTPLSGALYDERIYVPISRGIDAASNG